MNPKAKKAVSEVLESGYIGEGTKAKLFEQEFSSFVGRPVRLVNSATSAIDLALHMIGIQAGDEVITTPITCTATNSNAVNRGATLVWADVDRNGLIDPNDVANKITSKTKAIIGVSWGGVMPDYAALKSFGIPVIEDAAHGEYFTNKERGDYIVWSFQAIKHLTCGDGGALYSPDHNRSRLLRWFGLDRESSADFRCAQNITEVGYKYHMNDINASIGLANILDLPLLLRIHRENAAYYDKHLTNPYIEKLQVTSQSRWLYTILVEDRDYFIEYLKGRGIAASQVHARNDKHTAFQRVSRFSMQNAGVQRFDDCQVSIPIGWWLTRKQQDYIISTIYDYQPK